MLHRFFHFLKQSLLVVLCILLLGGLLAGGWFFYQGRQLYRSAASSYPVASMYDTLCDPRELYVPTMRCRRSILTQSSAPRTSSFMTHKGIEPGGHCPRPAGRPAHPLAGRGWQHPDPAACQERAVHAGQASGPQGCRDACCF